MRITNDLQRYLHLKNALFTFYIDNRYNIFDDEFGKFLGTWNVCELRAGIMIPLQTYLQEYFINKSDSKASILIWLYSIKVENPSGYLSKLSARRNPQIIRSSSNTGQTRCDLTFRRQKCNFASWSRSGLKDQAKLECTDRPRIQCYKMVA